MSLSPLQITLRFTGGSEPSVCREWTSVVEGVGVVEVSVWRRSRAGFLLSLPDQAALATVTIDDPQLAEVTPLADARFHVRMKAAGQTVLRARLRDLTGEMSLTVLEPGPARSLRLLLADEGGLRILCHSEHHDRLYRPVTAAHGLRLWLEGGGLGLGADGALTVADDAGAAQVTAQLGDLRAQAALGVSGGVVTLLSTTQFQEAWPVGEAREAWVEVQRAEHRGAGGALDRPGPLGAAVTEGRPGHTQGLQVVGLDGGVARAMGAWIHPIAAGRTRVELLLDGLRLLQELRVVAPVIGGIQLHSGSTTGVMYLNPGEVRQVQVDARGLDGGSRPLSAVGFVEVSGPGPGGAVEVRPAGLSWEVRAVHAGEARLVARCPGHEDALLVRVCHSSEASYF